MAIPKYIDPFKKRLKIKIPIVNEIRNHKTLAQDYEYNRGSALINTKLAFENRAPPGFFNLYGKETKMNLKYW